MRRLLPILLVLAAPTLFASPLEVRSDTLALTIDVLSARADSLELVASLNDMATGQVFSARPITVARARPTIERAEVAGRTYTLNVVAQTGHLQASVVVRQGAELIDEVRGFWRAKTYEVSDVALPVPTRMTTDGVALRVGGDVKAPVVISRAEPIYPAEARKARISGIVILETVIDRNGDVRDVTVMKGLPYGLSEAAADAVRQWKFRPATLNGQPVDVIFNLTVSFRLTGREGDPPPPPPS